MRLMVSDAGSVKITLHPNLWRRAMPLLTAFLKIVLLLTVGFIASNSLGAEPDPVAQTNAPKVTAVAPSAQATTSSNAPSATPEAEPRAQKSLTDPNIGRALEAFQPSESISADNAVPFPINI